MSIGAGRAVRFLSVLFMGLALLSSQAANAQDFPAFRNLDANGVDLTQGDFSSDTYIIFKAADLAAVRRDTPAAVPYSRRCGKITVKFTKESVKSKTAC